ncbi:MAG: GNAT family N-acetyltransferase [Alphaproteobacteria bacterium]|nr:GNAT family N-acetyltransferase [Alphaproteobacteria bacterium]
MNDTLTLRTAEDQDRPALTAMNERAFGGHGTEHIDLQYDYQKRGERIILTAHRAGRLVGYCIFNRKPKYAYYRAHLIPEIQDIKVLPEYRQRGIATALIETCEKMARQEGFKAIGISFGLHAGFGPAQRLYIKLGYRPDGQGVTYDRKIVTAGEFKPVDDQLCLMLVKDLC